MPIHILEAEIVLGVLYRKGVIPQKGSTLGSPELEGKFMTFPAREKLPQAIFLASKDVMGKGGFAKGGLFEGQGKTIN